MVAHFRSCCVVHATVVVRRRWRSSSVGAPDNLPQHDCGSASAERSNEPLLPDRSAVVIWKRICSPSCLCLAASRAAATRPQTVCRRREPMPRPADAPAGAFSGLLVLLVLHALADTAAGAISLSKAEVDEVSPAPRSSWRCVTRALRFLTPRFRSHRRSLREDHVPRSCPWKEGTEGDRRKPVALPDTSLTLNAAS
ncbi:hypothetical protein HPB50_010129 [Hyalomma asiaticum]|uniref:Uncharacterized protein n=1 Tax=Hyalomma asiaticum TaxID=266040 RepID=A0ACB7TI86_HYAAI|nr:hypothetical protein HPB50_010129 [Hyalomma asiaticum]